jgi:NADH-quinone oxidoreductase subunit A
VSKAPKRAGGMAAREGGAAVENAAALQASEGDWTHNIMLEQYFPVLLFIVVGIGIGLVLLTVGRLLSPNKPDAEKLSPYECGFEAFEDARMKFDVRYYLIAILFILFDLEIAFLFPWAVVLPDIGIFGFWSMMVFLAILIVGFVYEWKKGALEWE